MQIAALPTKERQRRLAHIDHYATTPASPDARRSYLAALAARLRVLCPELAKPEKVAKVASPVSTVDDFAARRKAAGAKAAATRRANLGIDSGTTPVVRVGPSADERAARQRLAGQKAAATRRANREAASQATA